MSFTGRIAFVVISALIGLAIGYAVTDALTASPPLPVEPIHLDADPDGPTSSTSSTTTVPGGAIVVPPPTLGPAPTQPPPAPSDDDDDHDDDDDDEDD